MAKELKFSSGPGPDVEFAPESRATEIVVQQPTPMSIIQQAVGHLARAGESAPALVEAIERLTALKEREEDRAASKEFAKAFAAFQQECPAIIKNRAARNTKRAEGSQVMYHYADLTQISETVDPILAKHGFSYSWSGEQTKDTVMSICTLWHESGHSRTASFSCPPDGNNMMSGPQKNASSSTYAMRQTLVQVLGITTADPDSDAARAQVEPFETIDKETALDLQAECEDLGINIVRFLQWARVEDFEDIPLKNLNKVRAVIKMRREKGGK